MDFVLCFFFLFLYEKALTGLASSVRCPLPLPANERTTRDPFEFFVFFSDYETHEFLFLFLNLFYYFFFAVSLVIGIYSNHRKSHRVVCRASSLERQKYKCLNLLAFFFCEFVTVLFWKHNA